TVTITHLLQDPETIVSSGQNFRLGIFSPANSSNHYVGIVYNILGTITIWMANRDEPLKDSSGIVTISEDCNLVILNGQKQVIRSSNVSNFVANSSAQLSDTGNLVLTDNSDESAMWESFQIPTDSLVSKMRLNVGLNLFQIPQFFVWKNNEPCWRSGTWNSNTFIGIPGMSSAYQSRLDLVEGNVGSTYFTYNSVNNPALFYYTLNTSVFNWERRLEYDMVKS
ncbi:hypothetical protein ACH5RR_016200, partial [Cinchona calisaya]